MPSFTMLVPSTIASFRPMHATRALLVPKGNPVAFVELS